MQYMLLIYSAESSQPAPGTPEFDTVMQGYIALNEELKANGKTLGSNPLDSVSTATAVRVRDGRVATTDGPFAETKEQLGGYFLVECEDLDEAIGYAARIPTAAHGTIEVRPIKVFS